MSLYQPPVIDDSSDEEPPYTITGVQQDTQKLTNNQLNIQMPQSSGSDDEIPNSIRYEQPAPSNAFNNLPQAPIEIYGNESDSEDEIPVSIQFEQRPLLERRRNLNTRIISWKDVTNTDIFLSRLYAYYQQKGFLCSIISQVTHLINILFAIFLFIFTTSCVDYSLINQKNRLYDVVVENCTAKMSTFNWLFMLGFIVSWIIQLGKLMSEITPLLEMKAFYSKVLEISDKELENIPWSTVCAKIIETRNSQVPQLPKLDPLSIANRILRKDNYMIALINKKVIDVPMLTNLMEWNLEFCIFAFVFNEKGIKKRFLKESNKQKLQEQLQERFKTVAILNLLLSPFTFIFLIVYSFFKVSEEYQKNSQVIGYRKYSPFALWTFREFNEYPHLLRHRLNLSHDSANRYITQFQKRLYVIIAKCVSFLAGSLLTVLLLITLFEEDMQRGFEITPGRSALFYIGICGTILAAAGSLIPKEQDVFEPEKYFKLLTLDTHYFPDEWRDKVHLESTRNEFAVLFPNKYLLIVYELVSIIVTPFVLYYQLSCTSPQIIDFFRKFTVLDPTVGHVCSFSRFDLKKHGNNARFGAQGIVDDAMVSNQGKMELSVLNFKAHNPDWQPRHELFQVLSQSRQVHDFPVADSFFNGSVVKPDNVGRELVALLDAIYESNRKNL